MRREAQIEDIEAIKREARNAYEDNVKMSNNV